MKTKTTFSVLMLLITLMITKLGHAEMYKAGEHYDILETPAKLKNPSKVEVREFFWFGCPHCYELEKHLAPWVKELPEDVSFVATPTPMSSKWVNHAQAYYVAKKLGKLDTLKPAIFNAIHEKNQPLKREQDLAKFFADHGVAREQFEKLFGSFAIQHQVRKAGELSKFYKLRSVPALVINGKYLVRAKTGVNSADMVSITEFLVAKERAAQGQASATGAMTSH